MTGPRGVLLEGVGLHRSYAQRGGALASRRRRVEAVAGVSVQLGEGERIGLVGGSGAGKSTTVRLIAGLEQPDKGHVRFEGADVRELSPGARRHFRRQVQVVFQDPAAALDPRQTIGSAVAEPLTIHGNGREAGGRNRVARLLDDVGLPTDEDFAARFPHELSGGERQRVVIARALACDPRVLLLDEPVASLDVSVRGQVLNLLFDLQQRLRLAILVVAHDISLVKASCDRMAVMYEGRIVEEGPSAALTARPGHPYTLALLGAAAENPNPHGTLATHRSASGQQTKPTGCRYRGSCPRADQRCEREPALEPAVGDETRGVACWNSLLP